MSAQLDIFTAIAVATADPCTEHIPCTEVAAPPKRTQMKGELPGTTWEDAFGGTA